MTHRKPRIGDWFQDNDPRSDYPIKKQVIELTETHARLVGRFNSGHTRIRLDRMHCDGKPRRSGWSLLEGYNPIKE